MELIAAEISFMESLKEIKKLKSNKIVSKVGRKESSKRNIQELHTIGV